MCFNFNTLSENSVRPLLRMSYLTAVGEWRWPLLTVVRYWCIHRITTAIDDCCTYSFAYIYAFTVTGIISIMQHAICKNVIISQ